MKGKADGDVIYGATLVVASSDRSTPTNLRVTQWPV